METNYKSGFVMKFEQIRKKQSMESIIENIIQGKILENSNGFHIID